MIPRLQSAISLFTCSCLVSMASATSANIGLVMTTGDVQVNGLRVPGTSAIFSGNLISSGDRSSSLQFSDGTSALMRPGTTLTVYREHSVLQRGITLQRGVDKHPILADGLKISGTAPNAVALVGVKDASYLEVAAQEGESDVWTSSGDLVARVEPGKTVHFAIGQAAPGTETKTAKLCGSLDQNFIITDHFSYVTYQLKGSGLDRYVGKTVRVTGTVSGDPNSTTAQILTVSSITKLNRVCEAGAVVLSRGDIALMVVVGAGGTLLGLGVAGAFTGGSQAPVTPVTP